MGKAFILFLYGLTLYITLKAWYDEGNQGLPEPGQIAPASWLFGILALAADFLEGLPVILAAALTFALWERTQRITPETPASNKNEKKTAASKPALNLGKKG